MNPAVYLEKLKSKPLPKHSLKKGVDIRIVKPNVLPNTDYDEPPYETKIASEPILIQDLRNKRPFDRNVVLDRIFRKKTATGEGSKEPVSIVPAEPRQDVLENDAVEDEIVNAELDLDPGLDLEKGLDKGLVEDSDLVLDEDEVMFQIPKNKKDTQPQKKTVTEPEAAKAPVLGEKVVIKRKRTAPVVTEANPPWMNMLNAKIGDRRVSDRLPKSKEKIHLESSHYYMNNRKLFIKQLSDLFRPYRNEIAENQDLITCNPKDNVSGFDLLTHQKVVRDYLNLYTPYRGLLLYHGLGSGKCLALNTPLIMYDGTIKLVQNVVEGDLLMGDDSTPRTVTSLARGFDKMYKIVQYSGDDYTVNSEHILCLKMEGYPEMKEDGQTSIHIEWIENNQFCSKTFERNDEITYIRVHIAAESFMESILKNPLTNSNIIEITIQDYLELPNTKKSRLMGYKVPVDFAESFHEMSPRNKGLELCNKKMAPNTIPLSYKCSSRKQRLELLGGILDSIGRCVKNGYSVFHSDMSFIKDIMFICRSLGIVCDLQKDDQKHSHIMIWGKGYQLIPTKIGHYLPEFKNDVEANLNTSIEVAYVGDENYYGFTLDGNCRFLLGDFTVTHNTCTSIAIAEGMKSHKRVVVMTPASLKMNFFSELKKCGDELYKKNQYWDFISTEGKPDYVTILSNSLQLPIEYVRSKKGAWLVDVSKPANYKELTSDEQSQIDDQLNFMIRSKYTDINYNGLTRKKVNELTENNTKNPFDNAVVVIDEAHNFVSRIVNKLPKTDKKDLKKPIHKKGTGADAGADADEDKTPLSVILYHYLMDAKNARVVLLTGTPIINYPNEIGILFNILRGYIKTWQFQLRVVTEQPVTRDTILSMFDDENFRTFDYVEYSGNILTITRNPYGFINSRKRGPAGKKKGGSSSNKSKKSVKKSPKKGSNTPRKTKKKMGNRSETEPYRIENGVIKRSIDRLDIEIDDSEESEESKEYDSYFKDAYVGDFSPHSGGSSDVFNRYNGVKLDDTGNISDEQFVSTIKRILGKNEIEIVDHATKVTNYKCLPDDSETFLDTFVEPGAMQMKNEALFKRRVLGLSSYFRSAQEQLLPNYVLNDQGEIFHLVRTEMSEYQFGIYEQIRKMEEDREKQNRKRASKAIKNGDIFEVASTYRIFSRAACNFAFPDPPGRPHPNKGEKSKETDVDQEDQDDDNIDENDIDANPASIRSLNNDFITEEDALSKEIPPDYNKRIEKALQFLTYDPAQPREQEYLTTDALPKFSPKFLSILENIQDEENKGLHLLYTQFRTIEGVGILKLILEANGYAEFKIKRVSGEDSWEIVQKPEDEYKPKFVLYTGTETADEKEIIRNIYNSDWGYVPISIVTELRKQSPNNLFGEVIKLMMITASGAEGINLKNTRFVHIVEPYWHMVRIQQVIGRARRICSHQDLPEELRNIKVFLYLSILPRYLITDRDKKAKHLELINRDISRLDNKTPVTTDESLFESSSMKQKTNDQILKAIKETAIDCSLYAAGNKSETLVCYGYGKVESNQFASYPNLERDQAEKDELNIRKEKLQLKNITVGAIKYAWNESTREIFDYESTQRAKNTGEDIIYVGKLVQDGPRTFHIDKTAPRT
jgi:hypothetical protein